MAGALLTPPASRLVILLSASSQAWKQKWKKKVESLGGRQPRTMAKEFCFQCGQLGHWASQCRKPGEASVLDQDYLERVLCSLGWG